MLARLGTILGLLLALTVILSCGGGGASAGQDTEAGVTAGGEGKRKEIEAKFGEVRDKVRPAAGDPILIAEGQKQYKRKCSFCHGVDGMKKIPLSQESAHRVSNFAPDDIAVQIHSGVNIHGKVRNHKQFPTLNGAELYATLLYVQNYFLQGRDADVWGPWRARLATGETAFNSNCASCHVVGTGGGPAAPGPAPAGDPAASAAPAATPGASFDREYLLTHSPQGMKEAITADAAHGTSGFDKISEDDRWAIAYWLQSQLYELP